MASSRSSGLLDEDTLVFTGRNRINAVTVIADGTNAASVVVYDNTAASGLAVAKVSVKATDTMQHVFFENPVLCENGIYADVTGTGATFIVYYGG